jgi:endogenous inhibitor of DNA gyrase (YacG/DUF329 family)
MSFSRLFEQFKPRKLLLILRNNELPVPCPHCGKLMVFDSKRHMLECRNPQCNLIMIRVFKDGKVRVFKQPKLKQGEKP